MSVVHIAGQAITIEGRYVRQRCSWCGAVLKDDDLALMAAPLNPDGSPPNLSMGFAIGTLVRVIEGNPRQMMAIDDDRLPLDFCDPRMVR